MGRTRDLIVDAAAEVLRERGLTRATTKEIARAAGLSEAALYKHFPAKIDIFIAVLKERTPGHLVEVLEGLPQRVGSGSVTAHLTEVARVAIMFYLATFPIAASVVAEKELLAAYRRELADRGAGPGAPLHALTAYLTAERAAGRISTEPEPAARLLLGGCLQYAFLAQFAGERPADRTVSRWASGLVKTLAGGL